MFLAVLQSSASSCTAANVNQHPQNAPVELLDWFDTCDWPGPGRESLSIPVEQSTLVMVGYPT